MSHRNNLANYVATEQDDDGNTPLDKLCQKMLRSYEKLKSDEPNENLSTLTLTLELASSVQHCCISVADGFFTDKLAEQLRKANEVRTYANSVAQRLISTSPIFDTKANALILSKLNP